MIKEIDEWVKGISLTYLEITNVTCSDTVIYFDVENDNLMGRVTCWIQGNYYAEIIDIATEQDIYSKEGCVSNYNELPNELSGFFQHFEHAIRM